MTLGLLLTTAATGFVVVCLHAVIPVHWLPFVAAGRAQGWGRARTLRVALLAGGAHVVVTALFGLLIAVLGVSVERWLGNVFPRVATSILVLFAIWYLYQQLKVGARQRHALALAAADAAAEDTTASPQRSDRAVVAGLVTMLMFAPCEAFMPMYVAGVPFGWLGFAVLTVTLAVATLAAMLAFTAFAWHGLALARVGFIERYEAGLIGITLLLLAGLMWWVF